MEFKIQNKQRKKRDKKSGFFFLKILFIYSTEIETASEEGTQVGGVGEEDTGSQWRSLMWGSIP